MKKGGPELLFLPLLNELLEMCQRVTSPRTSSGLHSPPPAEIESDGLRELGTFLLRPDVFPCLVIGIQQMEMMRGSRPRGRPAVFELQSKHARRAFRLWETVQNVPHVAWTSRNLIEMQQKTEPIVFRSEPDEILFPRSVAFSTLEESVSRGKTALQIDGAWHSRLCEKIKGI